MLDANTIAAIADAVAERVDEREQRRSGWVSAAVVAEHLGCETGFVYEHSGHLGAIRLGQGPRARLRFQLARVDAALATDPCSMSRGSHRPQPPTGAGIPRQSRAAAKGTTASLLPIRGRRAATERAS
jgi:hypothetical protein